MDYTMLSDYGLRALRVLAILGFGWWGINFLVNKVKDALRKVYPDELRIDLIGKIFYYGMMFAVIATVFYELGFNVAALVGAAGVVGVAVSFAAKTSVANVISGLFLMVERPFDIGDTVIVDGHEADVIGINLFATTLRKSDGKIVRVPHEKLLKSTLINLSSSEKRRHNVILNVKYKEDPRRVVSVIAEVVDANKYALAGQSPLIRVNNMTGEHLEVFIGAWASQKELGSLKKTLLPDIKERFEKDGIELAVTVVENITRD